ncbi:heterokaryon incompatibility, partial [Acephala macrosclerotiorum]
IRCSIIQDNLLEHPKFKALSYVWGDPTTISVPILVNGARYYVTPNCYAALQRLRELGESPVWIDAICINQKDNAEKSRQIPLMGEVYSQARQVLVWLGFSGVEGRRFGETEENLAFGLLRAFFLGIAMSATSPERSWSALKCLLSHKWFTRLWAHQEV